jgi:hypothetical protein
VLVWDLAMVSLIALPVVQARLSMNVWKIELMVFAGSRAALARAS